MGGWIKEEHTQQHNGAIGFLQAVAALLGAVSWPLTLLFLFLWFRSPLGMIVDEIPEKLAEASKITAGGLSFEIEKTAQQSGNPELAALVGDLSQTELELLLRTGGSPVYLLNYTLNTHPVEIEIPPPAEIKALINLEKKHLVEGDGPISNWYARILPNFQWKSSEHSESGRYIYVYSGVDQALTPEEAGHIYRNKYRLTELGRKAVDLIITSVSNEIKKGPKMATHD